MEILKFPHPSLLTLTEPVTVFGEELLVLLGKMYDTMLEHKGMGLAANQVGLRMRMFVMEGADGEKILAVNPEIVGCSKNFSTLSEGCLSAPGEFVIINSRSQWVAVKYKNEKGEERTRVFEDLYAVCVQHEMDHLNGRAFLDSDAIPKKKRKLLMKKWGLK